VTASSETPTRRAVLRARTAIEIRNAARDLLRRTGASGLSLRAVARSLGMTAPALYRYYDGRDALLEALSVDAYDALTACLVRAASAEDHPVRRLVAASLAYRQWALDATHEFALVFGTPVPGFEPGDDSPVGAAGARFGEVFLDLLRAAAGASPELRPMPIDQLPRPLVQRLEALAAVWPHEQAPAWLLQLWLSCWGRIHGAVSLEVFGHLRFVTGESAAAVGEQLFRSQLAELGALYGLGSAADSFAVPSPTSGRSSVAHRAAVTFDT